MTNVCWRLSCRSATPTQVFSRAQTVTAWASGIRSPASVSIPTKNARFQPPPAFHRYEAYRPLCRPDRNSTHHQTADTSHASRLLGVSAHVHKWSFERQLLHVGLIARASVSAPWLAEAGTSATDQPHCGYPSSTLTPGLRSLMAQNSPNCWLPTTWKSLASRHTFAYDGSERPKPAILWRPGPGDPWRGSPEEA
jgi:hypothetical protein